MRANNSEPERKAYLDGLRGAAACVVFFGHLSLSLTGGSWIFNGNSSVCIFFVLSGYVLSELAQHSTLTFPAQAARRYLRLIVPMLIASTFAWALLALGLYRNQQAAALLNSWWLGSWYKFNPSFFSMLTETLYGVFVTGRSDYNCNLWTMRPELIGSLYVFLIYATASSRRLRALCFAVMGILFNSDYVMLFAVGALLHDFHAECSDFLNAAWKNAILFLLGATLCVLPMKYLQRLPLSADEMYWHFAGATLIVSSVLHWRFAQAAFGSAVGRLLGRLSFVLYLIHVPIICSLTAWLVIALPRAIAAPVAAFVTVVAVFGVSLAIYRWADQMPTRWSRLAGYAIDGLLAADPAPTPALARRTTTGQA